MQYKNEKVQNENLITSFNINAYVQLCTHRLLSFFVFLHICKIHVLVSSEIVSTWLNWKAFKLNRYITLSVLTATFQVNPG